jgi:hypothetical protein
MGKRDVRWSVLLTVLLVGWTVAPAQAQWTATPYLGVNFAGDVERRKGVPVDRSAISATCWGSSLISSSSSISLRMPGQRPDATYCLGDLVGYAPFPNEVAERVQRDGTPTIMGNYDNGVGVRSG